MTRKMFVFKGPERAISSHSAKSRFLLSAEISSKIELSLAVFLSFCLFFSVSVLLLFSALLSIHHRPEAFFSEEKSLRPIWNVLWMAGSFFIFG